MFSQLPLPLLSLVLHIPVLVLLAGLNSSLQRLVFLVGVAGVFFVVGEFAFLGFVLSLVAEYFLL